MNHTQHYFFPAQHCAVCGEEARTLYESEERNFYKAVVQGKGGGRWLCERHKPEVWSAPVADKTKSAEDFHAHLDVCQQCQNNPFALCNIGHRLLSEATGEPV